MSMSAPAVQGHNLNQIIRAFVIENMFLGEEVEFADDASLVDTGAFDSTAAVELVAFLESTFGVRIDDSEISLDNLGSIDLIRGLVERKTVAAGE